MPVFDASPARDAPSVDLDSVLRSANAIYSETNLDELLDRLIQNALATAGAERACIVVMDDGVPIVQAVGTATGPTVLPSEPLDDGEHASPAVVNYVIRTRSELVIADARADERFQDCAYVLARNPQSLLCLPLVNQGALVGVTYLEHSHIAGAFPPERVIPLQVISSAMATAIENARMVRAIDDKNVALESSLEKIQQLEQIKFHLSKFVPVSVQRIIETNPDEPSLEMHAEDVSILFLDIAAYTSLSESLSLDSINFLLEHYFSAFLEDIHRNGGDINASAGDGLMIVFQDPDSRAHAVRAVDAALAIQGKCDQLNIDLAEEFPPIVINIGVNSGVASCRFDEVGESDGRSLDLHGERLDHEPCRPYRRVREGWRNDDQPNNRGASGRRL